MNTDRTTSERIDAMIPIIKGMGDITRSVAVAVTDFAFALDRFQSEYGKADWR